ncbi:MAG: hypothetical protein E6I87_11640 [Chloroflexi bacterium]|nr:MAG: hypothetical protein E6I87_11640 [Chloroflexota bacterium]
MAGRAATDGSGRSRGAVVCRRARRLGHPRRRPLGRRGSPALSRYARRAHQRPDRPRRRAASPARAIAFA